MPFGLVALSVPLQSPANPLPKTTRERRLLAWQILKSDRLDKTQQATLTALGADAIPASVAAWTAKDGRNEDFLYRFLMVDSYDDYASEIQRIIYCLLAWRGTGKAEEERQTWRQNSKGPAYLQRLYIKKYLGERDQGTRVAYLYASLPSRQKEVIDPLFARLKDPKGDKSLQNEIYFAIAQCERPDVLKWLSSAQPTSRKRSTSNPALSRKDSDRDGIPNNLDVNPFTAPRRLCEEENLLRSAFGYFLRRYSVSGATFQTSFPAGYKPFELLGIDGTLIPSSILSEKDREARLPDRTFKYPHLSLQFGQPSTAAKPSGASVGTKLRLRPKTKNAFVDISINYGNGFGGTTYRLEMRKIAGRWFPISRMRFSVS